MRRAGAAAIAIALVAGGCAHRDSVILFPNEGGAETGAVAVLDPATGRDLGVIDRANSRGRVSGHGVTVRGQKPAALDTRYGALLAALPEAPRGFTLYFVEGTTDLVAESRAMLPALFAEIARRPGADVQIVGHTDTVGKSDDNDVLSRRRAEEMANLLERMGLDIAIVRTSGRGERELKQRTGDDVRSRENRRVEVLVR